jgi:calcineurin-like phosphoesterase family protein
MRCSNPRNPFPTLDRRLNALQEESYRIVEKMCPTEIKGKTKILSFYPERVQESARERSRISFDYPMLDHLRH